MSNRRQKGFTLYELLITVLVIGVIVTIGIPNMVEFASNSRITATSNDLMSAFMLGRSEATRAREEVTVCASADGATCGAGATFDDGWILFVDIDGDGVVDAGDDDVLRVYPAIDDQIDITATDLNGNAATSFTWQPTGLGTGAGGEVAAAVLCDDRGNEIAPGGASSARLLIVTPLGRATVLRDVAQIAGRGGCP